MNCSVINLLYPAIHLHNQTNKQNDLKVALHHEKSSKMKSSLIDICQGLKTETEWLEESILILDVNIWNQL